MKVLLSYCFIDTDERVDVIHIGMTFTVIGSIDFRERIGIYPLIRSGFSLQETKVAFDILCKSLLSATTIV